jgi:hypothetical protein
MHRSSDRFAHQNRFGPPPPFRGASTYPRIDRLASGIPPMTLASARRPSLLAKLRAFGFPAATRLNRLTSPSVRTPWPVFRNGRWNAAPRLAPLRRFHAPSACSCLVSGSFQSPLRVLFSFHSRYYCAIGLGEYLGLEVCASRIHARFATRATLDPPLSRGCTTTGLSPSPAPHSQWTSCFSAREKQSLNTTSPLACRQGIRFALCRFRSPLLTASRLISSPAGTKMLQSPAFPIITDHAEA